MEPESDKPPDLLLIEDLGEFVRVVVDSLSQLDRRVRALEGRLEVIEPAAGKIDQISADLARVRKIAEHLRDRLPPRMPPSPSRGREAPDLSFDSLP